MLKKLLLIFLIGLGGIGNSTMAQYLKYEPCCQTPAYVSPPASYSTPATQQQYYVPPPPIENPVTLVTGYYRTDNGTQTVKLKVVTQDNRLYIIAIRSLGQDNWTEFTTKISLTKLQYGESGSNVFEYKAYVPVLLKDVYIQ